MVDYESVLVMAENIAELSQYVQGKLRIGDLVQRPIPIGDLFSPENEARRWQQTFRLVGWLD